jgi:pyruvate dehydrogenase E2 component (dihydrolipoamide acetyltransferase)
MAFEFHLPDIGEGLTEATVVSWLVQVGEKVGADDPIVEMETDKAVVEIPAPRPGVVLHHGAAAGEQIEVDALLVVIGDEGEEWSPRAAPAKEEAPAARKEAAPIVGSLDGGGSGGPMALPVVRKLAADLGVDLSTVQGTGPGGRITRQDVESAAAGRSGSPEDGERVRMSPTRRAIAANLSRSWSEIPHVTTYGSADAAGILAERKALMTDGATVPLEALLIHAIAPLLAEFPEFNAAVDGEDIVYRKRHDVGFAVDGPEGLVVAVVRDAAGREVRDLAGEIVRLATAVRDRTITADEMRGATFTVSNIGAVGGGYGTPIVPYGTSAILSVGRAEPQAVVRNGEVVAAPLMPLSLSYDHRLIDGSLGRRFLAAVVEALEARRG